MFSELYTLGGGPDLILFSPDAIANRLKFKTSLLLVIARNFLILSIPPTQRTPFIAGLPAEVRALYESDLSA